MKSLRDYFMPWDQLKLIHRAWSFRFAFIGAVLQGVYYSSETFQYFVSPLKFVLGMIGLSVAILVARIMNQSGIDF